MARMPGADWIGPTVNEYVGGMIDRHGLVLHIQDGTESGSESWFKDPSAQASAHFLNPKSGNLRQMVDTDDAAWTEMAGNRHWISVENEGLGGDALTASQIENCARLLAWLHSTYGVPLQSTDDPAGSGLGWHGMGGAAWGGHYDCPGEPVKAQRPAILARASQLVGQPAPVPQPAPTPKPTGPAWPGRYLRNYLTGSDVRQWQQRMHDRGWSITVDGCFGDPVNRTSQSDKVCRQFQAEKGLTVDGIVGPDTWAACFRTDNVT